MLKKRLTSAGVLSSSAVIPLTNESPISDHHGSKKAETVGQMVGTAGPWLHQAAREMHCIHSSRCAHPTDHLANPTLVMTMAIDPERISPTLRLSKQEQKVEDQRQWSRFPTQQGCPTPVTVTDLGTEERNAKGDWQNCHGLTTYRKLVLRR